MLRLYCRYFSIQLISALEYKVSFLLTALGQFFVSFAGFLSVFFMFQQFHTVDGFTYQQVLLCFSVVLSAFSIADGTTKNIYCWWNELLTLFMKLLRK
ncbi:MAG: hypothetical protein ACLTBV_17515 [Enterocloster bolteae]